MNESVERHPSSGQWRPDLDRITERIERALPAATAHPRVAALAIVARGRSGQDERAWAAQLGVPVGVVRGAETGEVGWTEVPEPLRAALEEQTEGVAQVLRWPGGHGDHPTRAAERQR